MTRYTGVAFGFNYDMEFETDAEFMTWLFTKLKAQIPSGLWERIVSKLLQQSDEYQQAKTMLQNHEARIKALEAKT